MKKALALIGTIIFVCSIVPMGAFATDSDYPDHTNNIAPYVHSIIALFDNSSTYTVASSISDVEFWNNGTSLGTATGWTFNVPSNCDCFDIDFWWPLTAPAGGSVVGLLNVYIRELQNIDYIELYAQGTYEACPIYYYTYYSNQLFIVFPGQGITSSNYYTLRIHVKQGGFQFNFLANVDPILYKYYTPDTNSSFQEQYTQWYYLTSLLRELDSLSINVNNLSIDLTNVNDSIDTIETILRNARNGWTYYNVDPGNDTFDMARLYLLNNDGVATGLPHTIYRNTNASDISVRNDFTLSLYCNLNTYEYPYLNVYIPVNSVPEFWGLYNYKINYVFLLNNLKSTTYYNLYVNFDDYYSDFAFSTFQYNANSNTHFLVVHIYCPNYHTMPNQVHSFLYLRFMTDYPNNTEYIHFNLNVHYDNTSWFYWCHGFNSQLGFEQTALTYFHRYDALLNQMVQQWQTYPSGPSDPQDPNQTTNIYDVNIEFNTQVGDISVFENTYSQQLPTYDQSISDQYLVPVSNSYDFSDLNSTFNSIWSSSFQYDTDEEDNIVGVYGIGLYFIIPLVLLVLFALFRRVTS